MNKVSLYLHSHASSLTSKCTWRIKYHRPSVFTVQYTQQGSQRHTYQPRVLGTWSHNYIVPITFWHSLTSRLPRFLSLLTTSALSKLGNDFDLGREVVFDINCYAIKNSSAHLFEVWEVGPQANGHLYAITNVMMCLLLDRMDKQIWGEALQIHLWDTTKKFVQATRACLLLWQFHVLVATSFL